MNMKLKVNFEYFVNNQERIYVSARASDVNEYDANDLKLRYEDEDGNPLEDFYPDILTYEDIREQAVEQLNDHKHNQGLSF